MMMYRALLMLLLLFPATGAGAQSRLLKSDIVDDFVGTWEYRHNGELFRLVLKKGTFELDPGWLIDCIVGGYAYRKSAGTPLVDYTTSIPATGNDENVKIVGLSAKRDGRIERAKDLALDFVDDGKEGKAAGPQSTITLLSPTTIRWRLVEGEQMILSDGEGNYLEGFEPKPLGFSVPTDVVLTKVVETPPSQLNPPVEPGKPIGRINDSR